MDYVYAALGGISCKVFDDLVDNKLTDNQTVLEALKAVSYTHLTLPTILRV